VTGVTSFACREGPNGGHGHRRRIWMADKKITPKAAASKDKQTADRAAARVSLKRTAKTTTKRTTKRTHKKV
jgi:hypothetical protein